MQSTVLAIAILSVRHTLGSVSEDCSQGRLHHRKLGANAPKKFQGGIFDVELGGNVFEKNICRPAAVIFLAYLINKLSEQKTAHIIDTFAQCLSKLQNMLGVHCALSASGDNN